MQNFSFLKRAFLLLVVVFAVAISGLLLYRVISGRSLGLRSFVNTQVYAISSLWKSVTNSSSVKAISTGNYTNIIFLHHSVGHNLIEQGQVRELFTQAGYVFFDHDYNHIGLRDPSGEHLGYSYNVPQDNTDPDGLAGIFSQHLYPIPVNAFSGLMQHEVIIFKSCFPTSDIPSEEMLDEYKAYYLGMRDVFNEHLDKIFIVVTPPPLNPSETKMEIAMRARRFSDWLGSDEYLGGRSNVFTFDLFDLLAEGDSQSPEFNMLKAEFREDEDSHPTREVNQRIGPIFVEVVIKSINGYK